MNKEYLPSKKFITILLFIFVLIVLFFTFKGIISLFKGKGTDKGLPTKMLVVGDLIQKDSNNNGIPDWEEYLWGLDPKKNGAENKEFILAKKKELQQSGEMFSSDSSKTVTDNEMLSQEFFATIISLQQTGQLDETSMKSVSEAIGKNIDVTPIPDTYTSNMLKVQNDSLTVKESYNEALSSLITKYGDADIGSELTLVTQGLSNKDPQALYAARSIAAAYKSFGRELMEITVPRSLSATHLSAANNYEKVGQSIQDLTQVLTDPLTGMKAIIHYKNYSDELATNLERISEFLQ